MSSEHLICTTQGSELTVIEINAQISLTVIIPMDVSITQLVFPNLKSISIMASGSPYQMANTTANVMAMLDTQGNEKLTSISLGYNTALSILISDFYPQYIPLDTVEFNQITIEQIVPEKFITRLKSIKINQCVFSEPTGGQIDLNPASIHSKLTTINIDFPSTQVRSIYPINDSSFPLLDELTMTSPTQLGVTLNHTNITWLSLKRTPQNLAPGTLNIIRANSLANLNLNNFKATPNDLRPLSISAASITYCSANVIQFDNLNELSYTWSNLTTFPAVDTFNNQSNGLVQSLTLYGNNITGPLPVYPSISSITVSQNPSFAGPIPDHYCSLQLEQMSFQDTALKNVPECFLCAWTKAKGLFSGSLMSGLPSGFTCNSSIDLKVFLMTPTTNMTSITITGSNLGFGVDGDMSPGLKCLVPNQQFVYTPPTPNGPGNLQFSISDSISKSINWATDITMVSRAVAERYYSDWEITVLGNFDVNLQYNISVNLQTMVATQVTPNFIKCIVTATTMSRMPKQVGVLNNYQKKVGAIQIMKYPSISSFSKTTTDSKDIAFYGYFSIITNATLNVTINGLGCRVAFINSSLLICNVTTGQLKPGYANLSLAINGELFQSDQYLLISSSSIVDDCGASSGCSGNGQCVEGRCQCAKGFGGYYCESRTNDGVVVITPDASSPATVIKSEGATFLFNVVAIQELDQIGQLVSELLTTTWTSTTINTDTMTSHIYNLTSFNQTLNLKVSSRLDVSTVERTVVFAGQTFTCSPNSVKLTMSIEHWPFQSNLNTLRMVLHKDGTLNNDTGVCGTKSVVSVDPFNNMQYLKVINNNGVELYGRFLPYAMSDGRPALSRNEIINTTNSSTFIGINMPHCLDECVVDPDFSVLVNPSPQPCDDQTNRWKLPVIIVSVIVGTILVSIITVSIIKRRLKGRRLRDVVTHKLKKISN
ncbi:hypothetical protein SAMD00019534_055730 [Acytostelium subglobosum LB1]|uniref:hypothetical protein n=1 Tax=Acytostelium subglobosum LB1 TaxID=1410327 RepID=UPI000644968C|nr:hypothetical protein SAMD00019534_055730 [Acytostelium subglobosum LB1]GAM22398.1 hypothetical protein SAMD00019534_055730 [Acytostelium subglobosum LB1]|eukprot:XP_012754518.1 hypothetical protein SAMD00019534_055730 [Acytostelium subglobosum LB1]